MCVFNMLKLCVLYLLRTYCINIMLYYAIIISKSIFIEVYVYSYYGEFTVINVTLNTH